VGGTRTKKLFHKTGREMNQKRGGATASRRARRHVQRPPGHGLGGLSRGSGWNPFTFKTKTRGKEMDNLRMETPMTTMNGQFMHRVKGGGSKKKKKDGKGTGKNIGAYR